MWTLRSPILGSGGGVPGTGRPPAFPPSESASRGERRFRLPSDESAGEARRAELLRSRRAERQTDAPQHERLGTRPDGEADEAPTAVDGPRQDARVQERDGRGRGDGLARTGETPREGGPEARAAAGGVATTTPPEPGASSAGAQGGGSGPGLPGSGAPADGGSGAAATPFPEELLGSTTSGRAPAEIGQPARSSATGAAAIAAAAPSEGASASRPLVAIAPTGDGASTRAHAAEAAKAPLPDPAGASVRAEEIAKAAEILRQIKMNLSPGMRRATIELQPAELGRLSIEVAVHEGRVNAVLRADSPHTVELLERQAPELRAMLAQQGIEADTLSMELGFGQAGGRNFQRSLLGAAMRAKAPVVPANEPTIESVSHDRRSSVASGIDTYA